VLALLGLVVVEVGQLRHVVLLLLVDGGVVSEDALDGEGRAQLLDYREQWALELAGA
jgi:predicted ATPase